ncbi:uncharacterized protein LOC142489990 [Ascaphus truei]|uniref:uncharacterized protein LOC142489990 n=1 Tax=Ascaphus truei TaxID=8439 RepID=UPI003F598160
MSKKINKTPRKKGLPEYSGRGRTSRAALAMAPASRTGSESEEEGEGDAGEAQGLLPVRGCNFERLYTDLKSLLQAEIKELRKEVGSLGTRTSDPEGRVDANAKSAQKNTKKTVDLQQQINELRERQEDVDNRDRQNNIRLRGVPETVGDCEDFVSRWLEHLCPDSPKDRLLMDRCHRALRSRPLQNEQPRDIIVRLHYYSTREAVLQKARNSAAAEFEGAKLMVFQDLSPSTLARRRNLWPITKVLRDKAIRYRWTFQFGLLVV